MSKRNTTASPLRLGILGCAQIARQFARDVALSAEVKVVAVASRKLETAAEFSKTFGISRHYGSYVELLSDVNVDAIYLPLPNSLHAEWAIQAADAGKHVLCEKPLSLGLAQAQRMFDAAQKNKVMLLEAYPYYFQPQTGAMLDILRAGGIGAVRSVQASFGFNLANAANNIRLKPELGGGALLDAGSYAVSLIRLVMGCAPQRVHAHATWASSDVDISLMATLFYSDGRRAQLSCAMDTAYQRIATIAGSLGVIQTEFQNHTASRVNDNAFGYIPSRLSVRRGTANTIAYEDIVCGSGSGFRFAAEAFAQVVRQSDFDAIARAAQVSLDNAATLEAIGQSARLGHAVDVTGPLERSSRS